jgi:Tfp pilus assembly protein PilN
MSLTNLLPPEEQKDLGLEIMAGQVFRFWASVLVSLALVVIVGLGIMLLLEQRITDSNNDIEVKKQSLNTSATRQLEQEVLTLNTQIQLVDSLYTNHYRWSAALTELSYLVDAGTVLTSVQLERETGQVIVTGESDDRDGVLAFWSDVMKSKVLKDVDFPLTNLETNVNPNFTFTFFVEAEELTKP